MSEVSVKVGLDSDRTIASIELVGGGGEALSAGLSAAEVEAVIQALASVRERMTPEVPKAVPEGKMSAPADPVWAIPGDQSNPDKALLLRHPGLGWLGFYFPRWSAGAIAKALLAGGAEQEQPPPMLPMGPIPTSETAPQTKN